MKMAYNGYIYEALNTKEAYDFASYLAKPILEFIHEFKNTMVTASGTLLPEYEKYNIHNKFEIPIDEIPQLRKKMFSKNGKGDIRNGLFNSILNKGYFLILDYKDLENHNGVSKCANTTKGIDPRTVKHYIEISKLWRLHAELKRTVEHELVHVYHCDKSIEEFVKSFSKTVMYDIHYDHEVAANFKGISTAIERTLNDIYIMPIVALRNSIMRYNNKNEIEKPIEDIKSELTYLKREYASVIRDAPTFIYHIRELWDHMVKQYPILIPEEIAFRYEDRFDLLRPYIKDLYDKLKQRGFFEISLDQINNLK